MNELRLLIITLPSAFGLFVALDFVRFLYQEIQPHPLSISEREQLVSEASQLCDRLVEVERLAFQQYLKAPDVQTLQQCRLRLEQIRQLYGKAQQRYQRRMDRVQLHQAMESLAPS